LRFGRIGRPWIRLNGGLPLDRYQGTCGEKMDRLRSLILTWMVCLGITTGLYTASAAAETLILGTISDGDSGTSTLVQLNSDDWQNPDSLGPVGYLVNGMAWDDASDTLYASTSTNDAAFTGLITIDLSSGAGTIVGAEDWGQAAGYSVSNITIDSDGTLYGWADNIDQPVVIDKESGTIVETIDASMTCTDVGFSFDKYDLLYLINGDGNIYILDTTNAFQGPGGDSTTMARHGDFHPSSNYYYGINATGDDTREIVLIDTYQSSGNVLDNYATVDQLQTLAFAVTGSSSGGGGGGSTCFIHTIGNTD
jgi:hypothetical protein